jgi:RHS repeat-associated protein
MILPSKYSHCVGIRTCSDYSPFGVELDDRTLSNYGYRFGYQGSEKDNEFKGDGNSYTTEFRQLDPRLGRWLTIDPMATAWESPYVSMGNNPIRYNDPKGVTVTVDKSITGNKDYNTAYNYWAATKTGKRFLKEYGVGGKSEHISVVFTLDKLDDTWGDTAGETRLRSVDKKTGVESIIPDVTLLKNADALLKGTDKTSYLKFTIALDNDQYLKGNYHKAFAVNTLVHETQHMRMDLQTLKSNKMIATAYQHHEWMSKDSWYKERYDTFKEIKFLWENDYNFKWKDKRSEDGYIKDKINYYRW